MLMIVIAALTERVVGCNGTLAHTSNSSRSRSVNDPMSKPASGSYANSLAIDSIDESSGACGSSGFEWWNQCWLVIADLANGPEKRQIEEANCPQRLGRMTMGSASSAASWLRLARPAPGAAP